MIIINDSELTLLASTSHAENVVVQSNSWTAHVLFEPRPRGVYFLSGLPKVSLAGQQRNIRSNNDNGRPQDAATIAVDSMGGHPVKVFILKTDKMLQR